MFLRQKRKKQVTATYPIPIITIHLKPIFLIILLMLTLLGTRQQYVLAQEIIEENIRDDAIVCPLTSALSSTATAHVGTSPFAPPEGTDTTFVVDDAPGLDTGCTFRNGGPLVFNIQVTRNFGDEDKLQAAKLIKATLRMPAYDVDFNGGGTTYGVCQASCRLFFSNEVPSSTAQFSHGLRRAIGGPFSAMRELCYTVPYSNGYTACLSAVFSIFCRLNFFKVTIVPGSQFLVLPDHLSGCFDLAF